MPLITINQVQKYYGDNHVLKGVDLDIDMGEVISIIGRSGSGKSTLLRCMNGLEGYQEGSIKLGGMTITSRDSQAREISRSIGMVFQNFNLFPHMTALENVMLAPRRVLKKSDAECRALATQMLVDAGVPAAQIDNVGVCTYCMAESGSSYRFNTHTGSGYHSRYSWIRRR